jgi:hypothetical protein
VLPTKSYRFNFGYVEEEIEKLPKKFLPESITKEYVAENRQNLCSIIIDFDASDSIVVSPAKFELEENREYFININGDEYTGRGSKNALNQIYLTYEGEAPAFDIYYSPSGNYNEFKNKTFSSGLLTISTTIIKQLDEKFIPDTIARSDVVTETFENVVFKNDLNSAIDSAL